MGEKALLSCREVSLGYERQRIWEHLNFTVWEGDYVCVVGENGSGKSTLIKGLLGLLRPMDGTLQMDESIRRGAIGYLPQQTPAQKNFPATVMEVVLSGFLNRSRFLLWYTSAQRSQALMHMGKLGILELKNHSYRDLSGGQQQRVLLARALCAARKLLILDEPVTSLDPAAAQDFYKTLRYLNQTEGMAVVMVTHDIPHALRDAKHVLYVGTHQQWYGTREEYLASPHGRRFGGEGS